MGRSKVEPHTAASGGRDKEDGYGEVARCYSSGPEIRTSTAILPSIHSRYIVVLGLQGFSTAFGARADGIANGNFISN